MLKRKNMIVHGAALCVLAAGFILARFVLFEFHHMRQWPELLFAAGVAAIAVSFFVKAERFPIFTALAYTVGFLAGLVFQTEGVDAGGAGTNNLWIIWTAVYICLPPIMMLVTPKDRTQE